MEHALTEGVLPLTNETGQVHAGLLLQRIFELNRALEQVNRALEQERLSARTDVLTGLPNRRALIEHLESALHDELKFIPPYTPLALGEKRNHEKEQEQVGVAIGFIDLDGFKAINDTYGHDAGDAVLREVADFLKKKFRENDAYALYKNPAEAKEMAGRIGGDEFLLILRHTNSNNLHERRIEIEGELNKLKIDFNKPNGQNVKIEIKGSLGLIDCNIKVSAEINLKVADALMYERKKERKEARSTSQSEALNNLEAVFFKPTAPAPSP